MKLRTIWMMVAFSLLLAISCFLWSVEAVARTTCCGGMQWNRSSLPAVEVLPDLMPNQNRANRGNPDGDYRCYGHPQGSISRGFYCSDLPHLVLIGLFGVGALGLCYSFVLSARLVNRWRDALALLTIVLGLVPGFIASWALISLLNNIHRESPSPQVVVQAARGVH